MERNKKYQNNKRKKTSRKTFLIFGSPRIEEDDIQEVVDCLRSGWLSTGPRVEMFERLITEYIGSRYACAINSCTAGLHLALIAAGVGNGDEVITTPMTFAATANVIIHVGAKPVFADVNRKTMNIDPNLIKDKITNRTKAIIPVHFGGRPCDMEHILDIAKTNNLFVISDAAHALEAEYRGKKVGNIGDMSSFSFYVTKNLSMGEGGVIATNNKEWAKKIQIYGLHGLDKGAWQRYSAKKTRHYKAVFPGFKYNMMDIQAALGIHQIKKIEKYLKIRKRIWEMYDDAFANLPVITPAPPEKNTRHARHLYTILLDTDHLNIDRDEFRQILHDENIGTGIHFIALHLHPYYSKTLGHKKGDFPNAEYISDRTVSLPLSAKLTEEDAHDVINSVINVVKGNTI